MTYETKNLYLSLFDTVPRRNFDLQSVFFSSLIIRMSVHYETQIKKRNILEQLSLR